MARFDLLYEQEFSNTDEIVVTHNLTRYVFNVRLIISGDPRLSQRQLVQDIRLDDTTPLDKCIVELTGVYTGTVQIIAEDTIQSPYYTVYEKLLSQNQTPLAGTAPIKFEYGGKANTGRVLEYIRSDDSIDVSFVIISDGFLKGVTFNSFAIGTGSIGIYAKRGVGADVLLHTVSFTNSKKEINKPLNVSLLENDEIYIKMDSGSVNKPTIVIYVQTI